MLLIVIVSVILTASLLSLTSLKTSLAGGEDVCSQWTGLAGAERPKGNIDNRPRR